MTPLVTRLIPATDRDAIVGDLLEEAAWQGMHGARLSWWLTRQCATIAVGLTGERARAACSLTLVREVVSGVATDSERVLRVAPLTLLARAALFSAGVLLLAYGAEILVGALLSAGNLH